LRRRSLRSDSWRRSDPSHNRRGARPASRAGGKSGRCGGPGDAGGPVSVYAPESLDIKGANFKGVYTFAGLVKHIAATNFLLWSGATGEKPPANVTDTKGPASLVLKAEIIQFLKDSFALGHRAAKAVTAENAMDMINGLGGQKMPRVFVVTFLPTHAFDEYGQMEEYLRMNGIIPPASAPRQ
jgi:hypothetical protein